MPTRQDMVDEAREWLDTPYGPGAIKGGSCSCGGLIAGILKNVGLFHIVEDIWSDLGMIRPRKRDSVGNTVRSKTVPVPWHARLPGDIILVKFGDERHVALLSGKDMIIHSDQKIGRVVEQRLPENWEVRGAFRFPGVED